MSVLQPHPGVTVVRPGEGQQGILGNAGVVFKLWSKDTGGALSVCEHPFPVGALVPPHTHTREDEYFIVLEGEVGFRSGDKEVVLGPGGYIAKPRGEMHTMWNAGSSPARIIEIISPGGFEDFFREIAELSESGPAPFETVVSIAETYGLQMNQPDWLPELMQRYNLHLPPGV